MTRCTKFSNLPSTTAVTLHYIAVLVQTGASLLTMVESKAIQTWFLKIVWQHIKDVFRIENLSQACKILVCRGHYGI